MRVRVSGVVFSGAHMISGHSKCEKLHGHNWSVSVSVEGEPSENGIVLDFLVLKKIVKEECEKLDHHVLLPQKSKNLKIRREENRVLVKSGEKDYVFPSEDVLILPVREVTAEELARFLAERLAERLPKIRSIVVEVEENRGQSAIYSLRNKKSK